MCDLCMKADFLSRRLCCSQNLTPVAQVALHEAFHTNAQIAEITLYALLGVTTGLSVRGSYVRYHTGLVFLVIFACLIARMFVFPLCSIANVRRPETSQISFRMQVPLWFAGLRGGVAFALSLNFPGANRPYVMGATLMLVIFTTFVQGGLTLPMLRLMGMTSQTADTLAAQQRALEGPSGITTGGGSESDALSPPTMDETDTSLPASPDRRSNQSTAPRFTRVKSAHHSTMLQQHTPQALRAGANAHSTMSLFSANPWLPSSVILAEGFDPDAEGVGDESANPLTIRDGVNDLGSIGGGHRTLKSSVRSVGSDDGERKTTRRELRDVTFEDPHGMAEGEELEDGEEPDGIATRTGASTLPAVAGGDKRSRSSAAAPASTSLEARFRYLDEIHLRSWFGDRFTQRDVFGRNHEVMLNGQTRSPISPLSPRSHSSAPDRRTRKQKRADEQLTAHARSLGPDTTREQQQAQHDKMEHQHEVHQQRVQQADHEVKQSAAMDSILTPPNDRDDDLNQTVSPVCLRERGNGGSSMEMEHGDGRLDLNGTLGESEAELQAVQFHLDAQGADPAALPPHIETSTGSQRGARTASRSGSHASESAAPEIKIHSSPSLSARSPAT
jgi:hypothetical protein